MKENSKNIYTIGKRIHAIRKSRNLSVNQLSALANVSASMVSQIEREQANPSLKTLDKIGSALGVSLNALLDHPTRQCEGELEFVQRKGNRRILYVGKQPLVKEILSPSTNADSSMMIITFPPCSHSEEMIRGPGQKAGQLLEGSLVLSVNGKEAVLYEGDSFQFDSNLAHSVRNDSEDTSARVLWIIMRATHTKGLF